MFIATKNFAVEKFTLTAITVIYFTRWGVKHNGEEAVRLAEEEATVFEEGDEIVIYSSPPPSAKLFPGLPPRVNEVLFTPEEDEIATISF